MVSPLATGRFRRPGRRTAPRRRAATLGPILIMALLGTVAACATTPPRNPAGSGKISVVAVENVWGDLAAQLGGARAGVTSVIDAPGADPHDYEPTAVDGRALATAQVVIVNGLGYDPWATKLLRANPSPHRTVVTVGDVVGARAGDNPHRWYSPDDVRAVLAAITAAYVRTRPADAGYYRQRHDQVLGRDLAGYFDTVQRIRARYAGTPIGGSESIVAMLAPALRLDLRTPRAFLNAVSEGGEPTPADKALIDRQIRTGEIKVYVYNSQNATPDIRAQVSAARTRGIPVSTITETLHGTSFQNWQVTQLSALEGALARATGR